MNRIITERAEAIPALGEVFREHGFDGASLSLISRATGLGKGSLYHFFPNGKEEMAAAVLEDIETWFEKNIFEPLRSEADAARAIRHSMMAAADYFRGGRRVCLVGAFALSDVRDRFPQRISGYFAAWRAALSDALQRLGRPRPTAEALAEEALVAIQGGLVVARALQDLEIFARCLRRAEERLELDRRQPVQHCRSLQMTSLR